jgi:HEAT repeat protein
LSRQAFDRKLDALRALRSVADSGAARQGLASSLKERNNYLVSTAAGIITDLRFEDLIPELLVAFDRFFDDPVKSDPQCMAKNAIAKALQDLGYHHAEPFLRGVVHVQLEPAFGGHADTAGTLRGTCALALVDCHIHDLEILTYLGDGLADPEKVVRIDCAIAINNLGRQEGALLLRLKLLTGDSQPDVLGYCFTSLLNLATPGGVSFVSRFLNSSLEDDVRREAASALAQSRDPEAISVLKSFWQEPLLNVELRRAVLINLGASPLPESADFLLSVLSTEDRTLALTALTALSTSRFHTQLSPQLAAAVANRNDPELEAAFTQHFT